MTRIVTVFMAIVDFFARTQVWLTHTILVVRQALLTMAPGHRVSSAVQPDGAIRSAAPPFLIKLPDGTTELRVGFYNVGIHVSEVGGAKRPRKKQALKHDLVRAFIKHGLNVLCLPELGEISGALAEDLHDT